MRSFFIDLMLINSWALHWQPASRILHCSLITSMIICMAAMYENQLIKKFPPPLLPPRLFLVFLHLQCPLKGILQLSSAGWRIHIWKDRVGLCQEAGPSPDVRNKSNHIMDVSTRRTNYTALTVIRTLSMCVGGNVCMLLCLYKLSAWPYRVSHVCWSVRCRSHIHLQRRVKSRWRACRQMLYQFYIKAALNCHHGFSTAWGFHSQRGHEVQAVTGEAQVVFLSFRCYVCCLFSVTACVTLRICCVSWFNFGPGWSFWT